MKRILIMGQIMHCIGIVIVSIYVPLIQFVVSALLLIVGSILITEATLKKIKE